MGKIAIDAEGKELVDEKIAPLIPMIRKHGLTVNLDECGEGSDDFPAWLSFPDPADALEFLLHTHHYTAYLLGDRIGLTLVHPTNSDRPRAKVSWLPELTHDLIEIWIRSMSDR